MQIIVEPDEAWSLMTVITSFVIDRSGISQDGKQKVRRWRTEHAQGTPAMQALAVAVNEALGTYVEQATNRQIKTKGRAVRARERA